MFKYNIHSLVIVSKTSREPVGIITKSDILQGLLQDQDCLHRDVMDYMTPDPVMISEQKSIREAVAIMNESDIQHLIVCKESMSEPLRRFALLEDIKPREKAIKPMVGVLAASDIFNNLHRLVPDV